MAEDAPKSNEELIRYGCIRTINQGEMDAGAEFVADDVDFHRKGEIMDYDALAEASEMWHDAFPDVEAEIDEVVSDDDWASFRYTVRGTHEGAFEGIPPTGKRIEAQGIGFAQIVDQEIVEYHLTFDGLGMLEQIGVFEEWEGKQ